MRFAVFASLVFTTLVAATDGNTCTVGDKYCCNSQAVASMLDPVTGLLSIPLNLFATLGCTPLTILGIPTGGTCNTNTLCCQNVAGTGGLINVQCINLGL